MALPFLRAALIAAFASLGANVLFASDDSPESYWVYFGTYTNKKDGSKGIQRSKLDVKTGKLSEPELAAEMGSPSFLAIHPNKQFLYAVGEGNDKEGGPVAAFAIDQKSGKLTKLNEAKSGGAGPCFVSVSPNGKFATVANYGGGSTKIFMLNEDGTLGKSIGFFQHIGSGKDPRRQKDPHAHCSFFTPDGNHVVTVDLGMDRVKVFALSADGAKEAADRDISTPPGSGPRHIAITPDGKYAYVCGELDSTVNVIKLDLAGKSEVIQSLSTLPEPTTGNSTAECILHPSGKFVYVSNRGHNSIAVFTVNEDHKLTAAGHIKGDIKTPRNFNIDPSGRWMLIASQGGHKVGVYEIDPNTGMAKETEAAVKVGEPVCVKFVPAR